MRQFPHRSTPGLRPAVWLLVLLLGSAGWAVPADVVEESTAKAALVFNFARYTSWPETAVRVSPNILRVCVMGDTTLAAAFQAISGRRVGNRRIRIKLILRRDDPLACDLIFIDSRDRNRISLLLSAVRGRPVLTVGRIPDFTDLGGIINLYRSDDRFRFEVSLKAAERANLVLSASMVRLARIAE